jgi:hypothetical protein
VLTLLPMPCPEPCNKSPFSAFTVPLYLVFRGGCLPPPLNMGVESQEFGPLVQSSSFNLSILRNLKATSWRPGSSGSVSSFK